MSTFFFLCLPFHFIYLFFFFIFYSLSSKSSRWGSLPGLWIRWDKMGVRFIRLLRFNSIPKLIQTDWENCEKQLLPLIKELKLSLPALSSEHKHHTKFHLNRLTGVQGNKSAWFCFHLTSTQVKVTEMIQVPVTMDPLEITVAVGWALNTNN